MGYPEEIKRLREGVVALQQHQDKRMPKGFLQASEALAGTFFLYYEDIPDIVWQDLAKQKISGYSGLIDRLKQWVASHKLDGFLKKHQDCRELVGFLMGTQFPHLYDPERLPSKEEVVSENVTDTISSDSSSGSKILDGEVPESGLWLNSTQAPKTDDGHGQKTETIPAFVPYGRVTSDNGEEPPKKLIMIAYQNFAGFKTKGDGILGTSVAAAYHATPTEKVDSPKEVAATNRNGIKTETPPKQDAQTGSLTAEQTKNGLEMNENSESKEDVIGSTKIIMKLQHPIVSPDRSMFVDAQSQGDDDSVQVVTSRPKPPKTPMATASVIEEWTQYKGISTITDIGLYPYKGWMIEGPKQLIARAKNFLADQDTDRTVNWELKFGELVEYFSYLMHNYSGEDWGYDLKEAIDMLRTHWIFEIQHYGRPELVLNFSRALPEASSRLPKLLGPRIKADDKSRRNPYCDLSLPRTVVHRPVNGAHDVQYGVPPDILSKYYLHKYKLEYKRYTQNLESTGKWRMEDNVASLENEEFEKFKSEGSVVELSHMLASPERFRYDLRDINEQGEDYTIQKTAMDNLAVYRGRKRAALQHCLNQFDNSANKAVVSWWKVFVLPDSPHSENEHDQIIFKPAAVKTVPETKSQDPFGFTKGHAWFQREQRRRSEWTKGAAVRKIIEEERLEREMEVQQEVEAQVDSSLIQNDPSMVLPPNFAGPVMGFSLSCNEMEALQKLEQCQILHQKLLRCSQRVPRQIITDIVDLVDEGLEGNSTEKWLIQFTAQDLAPGGHGQLAFIRTPEMRWLEFLCRPIHNPEPIEAAPIGRRAQILLSRVREMLNDPDPGSFFNENTKRKTAKQLMQKVNEFCVGPVERHEFTYQEILDDLPHLSERNVLKVHWPVDAPKSPTIEPADHIILPEERVSWLKDPLNSVHNNILPVASDSEWFTAWADQEGLMPRKSCLRQNEALSERTLELENELGTTVNFYHCLAYRLGMTIRRLQRLRATYETRLADPRGQTDNEKHMKRAMTMWRDYASTLASKAAHDTGLVIDPRVTPTYADVVAAVQPGQTDSPSEDKDKATVEAESRMTVRQGILREISENKSLLWPVQLVPSGLFAQSNVGNSTVQAPPRREPVWSFGHPSVKATKGQYWNIDNWPTHLQTKDVQREIRKRGPSRSAPHILNEDDVKRQLEEQVPDPDKAIELSYWDLAQLRRRTFTPGPVGFWHGDTPLQRRTFEQNIRSRFETAPQPTWKERLFNFFAGPARELTHEERFALPHVHPRDVLRSRPASVHSSEEQDDSDDGLGSSSEALDESDDQTDEDGDTVMKGSHEG